MKKNILFCAVSILSVAAIFLQLNCSETKEKTLTKTVLIAKGKYLVNLGGCNDCHSPKLMTNMGPVPDTTQLLSGHPAKEPTPDLDLKSVGVGKWTLASMDLTEWVGPWGVSFTANLTPDSSTGLGAWSFQDFVNTLRNGKHLGTGRNLLPPMPWQPMGQLKDEDLKAIFAYLQSIPAINNKVPNPVPPNMVADYLKKK